MSANNNEPEHVSRGEFNNVLEFLKKEYAETAAEIKEIRKCNKRIEDSLEPVIADYKERMKQKELNTESKKEVSVGVKLAIFGVFTAIVSSVITTAVLVLLKLPAGGH